MSESIIIICKGCEYLGSDSCRDSYWYVCDHPSFNEEYPEGRTTDLDTSPAWCPKRKAE